MSIGCNVQSCSLVNLYLQNEESTALFQNVQKTTSWGKKHEVEIDEAPDVLYKCPYKMLDRALPNKNKGI